MTKFVGSNRNDFANSVDGILVGFKPRLVAKLQDTQGDIFIAKGGDDGILGGVGNDNMNGGAGNDELLGNDGNDILNPGTTKLNQFGYGFDGVNGGKGNDTINVNPASAKNVFVTYNEEDFDDPIVGISVNLANNTATDTWGDTDTLNGVTFIVATNNDDTLLGDPNTDDIFAPGRSDTADTVSGGGGGIDTLTFFAVNFDLSNPNDREDGFDYVAGIVVTCSNATDNTGTATSSDDVNVNFDDIEFIVGTVHADTFNGSAFDDWFSGGLGADNFIGAGGGDTLDYSLDVVGGGRNGVTVDLDAGTATDGFGTNDTLSGMEYVIGTRFADSFAGNGLANSFSGGLGKDAINGEGGADGDIFFFRSAAEAGKGANADTITDFTGNGGLGDLLDVAGIDANTRKAGNQDFKFIAGKFHNKAGELHILDKPGFKLLEGDTNGDGKADFQIKLDGTVVITQDDINGLVIV